MTDFQNDLKKLINMHCVENESNTPDFILAKYLVSCLSAFEHATQEREDWYERNGTNPPPTHPHTEYWRR